MTVHLDLRSDELLSYMQGMGCSKLEKTQFLKDTLYYKTMLQSLIKLAKRKERRDLVGTILPLRTKYFNFS